MAPFPHAASCAFSGFSANIASISLAAYHKPGHTPQYVHFLSEHKLSMKMSIWKGECKRMQMLSQCPADYAKELRRIKSYLAQRGYPIGMLLEPLYDIHQRASDIQRFKNRDMTSERVKKLRYSDTDSVKSNSNSDIFIVLPWSRIWQQIPLVKYWKRASP
eukprot:5955870-Karenia_brevis.AAC.1